MERCLVFFLLLLICEYGSSQEQEEVCSRAAINSCGDCLRSGPYCVWCKRLDFTQPGEQDAVRCDTRAKLLERNCTEEEIISPQNHFSIVEDKPLAESFDQPDPVQLRPQQVNLRLRPGLPTTFTLYFKRVQGYPVDLYYLMDLSYSMEDDLANIKSLGKTLFETLKAETEHAKIGFGAFVDKTVLPFTNTNKDKLEKPCLETAKYCQAAFGYRHVLSMTADAKDFTKEVGKQYISGNLDSPEGSLDAMMQAAVCGDQIGWRNSSTKLIVLTTDAGFHMAGDGKLAGILEPNDEQCHMRDNLYVRSNDMDYPSVGQVARQFRDNNIQSIFAVTGNVTHTYQALSKMLPKSAVGELSSNSDNIVDLIKTAYKNLSSKVIVTHEGLPNNVRVTYTPICEHGGPAGASSGICDHVGVKTPVAFNVTVTADDCMDGASFYIRPLTIKDKLKVTLSTHCDCDCNDYSNSSHSYCNGKGQITCGVCRCNAGFVGHKCECAVGDKDENSLKESCQRDNGPECEGHGSCVCGRCQCSEKYYGPFCECDYEQCEVFENKVCGGNGDCRCKQCICKPGYEGSACHCVKSDRLCRNPNGNVCSNRGQCKCNRCECIQGYRGLYCNECPTCTSACKTKQKCIECLAFKTGPFAENCTESCKSVQHTMVDTFANPKSVCKQRDTEGCWMLFKMEQEDGPDNYKAEVQRTRECPELPNISAIIGGSLVGVALIGLLILLLIKALIYVKDLKEFRRFENEKKKAKWAQASNPIFQKATTTVTNPTFTGE